MPARFAIEIQSEVGRLEGVILHEPGPEVALMTPATAEKALYSDILNLGVARHEYRQLQGVLARWTTTFQVRELLAETLTSEIARRELIAAICTREAVPQLESQLIGLAPADLASRLIEGVPLIKDNLTRFLSADRFALPPLHNFFFTRDAAAVVGQRVVIGKMANVVRCREALIMETIFKHHPRLHAPTLSVERESPARAEVTLEGGDVLVVSDDILVIGIGARTSSQAVDAMLTRLSEGPGPRRILVQELPRSPESFIHLDMVFTLLDGDACMVYAPLILEHNHHETVVIELGDGRVGRIHTVDNLLAGLRELGVDLEPIVCGGTDDRWRQEREQWHSGTNFFTLAPGKVMGYARNEYTLAELDRHGFRVVPAADVIDGRDDLEGPGRCVVTIGGSELARGGGGCRCMTLPIRRASVPR